MKFERRASLFWSRKEHNYPDVGEVWSTHRDERLWLILMVGRVGWTSWAFEVVDLETAEITIIHTSDKWDQKRWKRQA